jgi:hypothetical protein
MGQSKSEVVKDELDEHFRMFHIQWWVFVRKRTKNDKKLYENCWQSKRQCNLTNPKQLLDITTIVFSFPT